MSSPTPNQKRRSVSLAHWELLIISLVFVAIYLSRETGTFGGAALAPRSGRGHQAAGAQSRTLRSPPHRTALRSRSIMLRAVLGPSVLLVAGREILRLIERSVQ